MRKAWAFALWSPISRERQKTKNDSQCESFLLRSLSPTELIRCSRITSDEENVNKLLCDARLRDFCDGELNYTKTTHSVSRFSIYTALLDVLESRVMKRTSISYWAVWEHSRADILGRKTSQCEVSGLWARVQLHKNDSLVSRFSIYTALLDVIESRVMKRTSIRYCAVRSFEPAMGKSTKLLQFYLSQIFYHYNVYIIMIFFVFILKHHDTNVYKSFSFF